MKVEDLKKYKDSLYSSLSRDLDAFEKNFILISSGMLAFSITFIKDIVKIDCADYLPLLFTGWLLILISDGLMMYAFLSSVNGSNSLRKIVDDFINNNDLFDNTIDLTIPQARSIKQLTNDELEKIKNRLRRFRLWAIWLFVLGVFSFGSFVSINIVKENAKHKDEFQKKEIKITVKDAVITSSDSLVIVAPNSESKTPKSTETKNTSTK